MANFTTSQIENNSNLRSFQNFGILKAGIKARFRGINLRLNFTL